MNIGIFGAGFSGKEIGRELSKQGNAVWGTTRSSEKFAELEGAGLEPIEFDGTDLNPAVRNALASTTHLIISIAPARQ